MMTEFELHAPMLLAYELTNIARKKSVEHPEYVQTASAALRTALNLHWHWSEVDHLAVLRLALETALTTYDASYLYLARSLGVPLVTFDERLAKAVA